MKITAEDRMEFVNACVFNAIKACHKSFTGKDRAIADDYCKNFLQLPLEEVINFEASPK